MRLIQRKLAEEDLKNKLNYKPTPQDIVNRGLAHNEFWEKSVDETTEHRRKSIELKKQQLNQKLNHKRRPSVADLVAEKIMPEDSEVIAELKNIAQSHKRMQSAVKDLSTRLPFEDETNLQVAETMMKHINATEEDIDLLWTTSEDDDDDNDDDDDDEQQRQQQESSEDPDIDYDQTSDIEPEDENTKKQTLNLDKIQKRNHKRRLSRDIENFLTKRPTMQDLEDDGVLKQTGIANSLRGSAVSLEEKMNQQIPRKELIQRNIIKRPSISRSLQPNAEALENELIKNLQKFKQEKSLQFESINNADHPLFKLQENNKNTKKTNKKKFHQRKPSGFGTKKNQNPSYYKHDIAPRLQETANKLHKRRLSKTISEALQARPTKQELIDSRILYKDRMANQLQGNALKLEEQLKQRVPENYLTMIGVLLHDKDKIAPSIQGASYELEYALRRRPSLFDGSSQDMVKILQIPSNHHDPNEFYTDKLYQIQEENESKQQQTKSNKKKFNKALHEMYPDDNDKANYRLRRARNGDKLEKRMTRRMSIEDLEKAGLIPKDYFEDPHGAIEMQRIHRKLREEDLKIGLKNRSTKQELISRGLTREEYFNMDMDQARNVIQKHSTSTKKQVEYQLNSIFNPQLIELEKNGVVEPGYFLTRAKQIEEGHRRLPSVTVELQKKLLANPQYNEELAKTLVHDLGSDSEDDDDSDDQSDDSSDDSDEDDDSEYETDSEEDTDQNGENDSDDDDDSEDFMDSDDEEQARRLQELEYKIGHRPSTDELIEKRILYKNVTDMAASIQNAAKNLQDAIGKRPSIHDLGEKGYLVSSNQDEVDTTSVINNNNNKQSTSTNNNNNKQNKKSKRSRKKDKHLEKKSNLNKKLNKTRRPTMLDLELRGIVPSGYFDDVETAMSEKKIRKENIIHDLASRLQGRPEFSEKLATKLMSKAMKSIKTRNQIVNSGKNQNDKALISEILTAKLSNRINFEELKNKNILSSSYHPQSSQKLIRKADELKKLQLQNKLESQLNARPDVDELYDSRYIKYKIHGQNGLSSTLHDVAINLEDGIKQRVDENYLKQKGIFDSNQQKQRKEIINNLDSKIKSRPSIGSIEQSGIAPHGAFENVNVANKAKHDRIQSIHDELNAFFEFDRPSKQDLIKKGVFNDGRRGSVKILESDDEDDTDEDNQEEEELYNPESPSIPPVPERPSSMFQTNTYTEIVMNSITFHNKKVIEPSYEIDVLVAEPDLNDEIIETSTLSFLNVLDNLNKIILKNIDNAKINFILKMKNKSKDLQLLKNLLRNLQQYGSAIINEEFDGIEFESCGDLDKDIENVWKKITKQQNELFELDNKYRPLHFKIKKLQNIKYELEEYNDKYKIQLSQLKRIKKRISSYIEENKMIKDSSNEAIKATDEQQAWMISKITNKIVKTQNKIDSIKEEISSSSSKNNQELQDELTTCNNFLNGLKEFLKGLKKLRKSSNDKIKHLQIIIQQLKQQENDILNNIKRIRQEAINKLNDIRTTYFLDDDDDDDQQIEQQKKKEEKPQQPQQQPLVDDDDDISDISEISDDDDDTEIELDFINSAPLSMLELMHKREKYMSKVYKKIHDLESRAMTTSSTDYLRGLTEIRELQIILNNSQLKYFYNHFVSSCNQIFNDCCLANQAILENTAEINTPLLTNLRGIQILNDLLSKNQRKLQSSNILQYLEIIVNFIQSLPDREVVIMQIARHLSLSLPFRSFIVGKDDINNNKEKEKNKRFNNNEEKDNNNNDDDDEHHLIKIDKFITNKIREWMGSILNIYGNNSFSSVRIALENDVVAQVRPSYAARLIVNCVYGFDIHN